MDNSDIQTTLAEALRFDESALRANHRGWIADKQLDIIREQIDARLQLDTQKFLGLIALLIGYVLLSFWMNASDTVTPVIVFLMGGCLFGGYILGKWLDMRNLRSDLQVDLNERKAKMVVGRVRFERYEEKLPDLLRIERQTFYYVPLRVRSAFVAKGRYRIYYSAKTKIILSAEPIDPNARIDDSWEDLH